MEQTNQPIDLVNNPESTPVEYAGFLMRLLAYFIDAIILSFALGIFWVILMAVLGVGTDAFADFDDPENFAAEMMAGSLIFAASIGSVVVVWLYYALMESGKNQATLGKMVLNLKVTDMNGGPISFGRATGRYFGKIISGAILYIGYIMIAFTDKQQGLHDMIANCLVVKK
ncbi:MAG: RDD family protein [Cyclobacteriaceae bacterium]|nr:RDD family protein [Cyclobacteriaceae bacterium]